MARLLDQKVDATRLDALHLEMQSCMDAVRRECADLVAQHAVHSVARAELDSELAKKLDIRTFLNASSANAAAATAGVACSWEGWWGTDKVVDGNAQALVTAWRESCLKHMMGAGRFQHAYIGAGEALLTRSASQAALACWAAPMACQGFEENGQSV